MITCGRALSRLGYHCTLNVTQAFSISTNRVSANASEIHQEKYEKRKIDDEEAQYEEEIKSKILNASLTQVALTGWSKESLIAGAKILGYPGTSHGLFPRGGIELVHHFYRTSNNQVLQSLENDASTLSTPKAIMLRNAIQKRLEMNSEYVENGRWIEAMGMMALPHNAIDSLKCLAEFCDGVWYLAGDKSSDINWYTKRAVLGTIYKSTEVYMIQDRTPGFEATWNFLDRQTDRVSQLIAISKTSSELASFAKGFLKTISNIAGIQRNNFR